MNCFHFGPWSLGLIQDRCLRSSGGRCRPDSLQLELRGASDSRCHGVLVHCRHLSSPRPAAVIMGFVGAFKKRVCSGRDSGCSETRLLYLRTVVWHMRPTMLTLSDDLSSAYAIVSASRTLRHGAYPSGRKVAAHLGVPGSRVHVLLDSAQYRISSLGIALTFW